MAAVETTGVIKSIRRTYQAGAANMLRGTAVMQGADDNHVIPATAGAVCIGILDESTISIGDPTSVVFALEAVAQIGAAVNAGQYLISNASAELIPTAAAGDQIAARAVSSGAAAGDFIVVLVTPFTR